MNLVLASRSPQRQAILRTLGVDFTVDVAGVEEATAGDAVAVAIENARRKALAVAERAPAGSLVLGSDTVIAVPADGAPLADGLTTDVAPWDELVASGPRRAVGKPDDAAAAAAMLRSWSGRAHHVVSAAAVVSAGAGGAVEFAGADASRVCFRSLDATDIDWYVGTGEWQERAGGYAIQLRGSLLVDGIVGDWWNVVGLPVSLLAREQPQLLR